MEEKAKKLVITRVKKIHPPGHGGSWKVAYADFVTALMAFFLLMWLLNMSSPEKKAVLALYFKNFSLFKTGGSSFTWEGSSSVMGDGSKKSGAGGDITEGGMKQYGLSPNQLKGWLISQMDQQLEDYKSHVLIDATKRAVRIQICDTEDGAMFPPGSSQLTEQAKAIIRIIADTAKVLPYRYIIEGHTDSTPLKGEITNWDLSLARACAARSELESDGIQSGRVVRVDGFANRMPLYKDKPEDPRNRRISILLVCQPDTKPNNGKKDLSDLLDFKY